MSGGRFLVSFEVDIDSDVATLDAVEEEMRQILTAGITDLQGATLEIEIDLSTVEAAELDENGDVIDEDEWEGEEEEEEEEEAGEGDEPT